MNDKKNKGVLIKWDDKKGFGFIKSETENQEIFLHISSLPKESRRPEIGDTITYKIQKETNGKLRANLAFIEGVVIKSSSNKNSKIKYARNNVMSKFLSLLTLIGLGVMAYKFSPRTSPPVIKTSPPVIPLVTNPDCKIKGNISQNSGKKYYHIEGMEDYESTVIDPQYGEKWFCTEDEAIRNGWTKAPK